MKRIITILMLVAAFGLLMGSVSAANLQAHDFDGHFTLDVPGNYWMTNANADGHMYKDGKGITIQYITAQDIKGASFADYLASSGLKNGKADGNFTVFQKDGKYVVVANSSDEMYIITDKNLDEAKAIASSAKLGTTDAAPAQNNATTTVVSNNSSVGDFERVNVGDVLTIKAPKGSEFDNGTVYDEFWRVFQSSKNKVIIYYANQTPSGRPMDDAYYKEFIGNITSSGKYNVFEDGNVTIVDGVQRIDATHIVYIHGDNKIATVSSDSIDLSKEMAKSIDFIR